MIIALLGILIAVFVIYIYNYYARRKRIEACVALFNSYPLLSRRLVSIYNKEHHTRFAIDVIDSISMKVSKNIVQEECSYNLIKLLSDYKIAKEKNDRIENRLNTVINCYIKYPRAVSVLFGYSSLSMYRSLITKPYSLEKIFSIGEIDLFNLKLDERKMQSIEKSIDKVLYLDAHQLDLKSIKPDAESIAKLLSNNSQEYLYHFTHKANLSQIKEMGGLYSWVKLDELGKTCQHPGGNYLSRNLDTKYGIADYVHLSFSFEHPMFHKKESDMAILLIHPIVCLIPETLFSNMNATDNDHSIGGGYEDLQKINFWATKMKYLNSGTKLFKAKQSEVLVKSFIPNDYIINLDFVD